MKKKISFIYHCLRNFYFFNFNKEYIANSLAKRKGKCNNCGKCCHDVFGITCMYYDLKNKKCKIHEFKSILRPLCKIFPYDKESIKLIGC